MKKLMDAIQAAMQEDTCLEHGDFSLHAWTSPVTEGQLCKCGEQKHIEAECGMHQTLNLNKDMN